MMHPGPDPVWAGGDGKAVHAWRHQPQPQSHPERHFAEHLWTPQGSWGDHSPHRCSSPQQHVEWKLSWSVKDVLVIISKASGGLPQRIWEPSAPQRKPKQSSVVVFWLQQCCDCILQDREQNPRQPSITSSLEGHAPSVGPKHCWDSLSTTKRWRGSGRKTEEGSNQAKFFRSNHLYTNSNTTSLHLQGVTVTSEPQAVGWVLSDWIWRMERIHERLEKQGRKSSWKWLDFVQEVCLAWLSVFFANVRWKRESVWA